MRIHILTTIAGAGHNQAARAIHKALQLEAPGQQCEYIDASDLSTPLVKELYNDAYLKMVEKAPALWGFFYEHYDKKKLSKVKEKLKSLFSKVNSRPLIKRLKSELPDVVVATHFYPAEVALRLRAKGKLQGRIEVVLTDFAPHTFWVLDGVDRYFVADEETRYSLSCRGVPADRIVVTGIPVDPKFAGRRDRTALAPQMGLDPAKFTVLVSSGGMGVGPLEEVVRAILAMGRVPQIVVVCGRNEKLKTSLDRLTPPAGVTLKVFGFVTNMEEMMGVADLLVSKCGGLTTSEALAVGLPILILQPIPGQEQQNTDFLLERGAALKANDVPTLTYKLAKVLDDRSLLDRMREAVGRIARPDAARRVARLVAGLTD